LKGTGFSPSVENWIQLPASATEGMQIAAKNLPQGLKPPFILAFDDVRAKVRTLH
jgi:hypothetical protein